MSTTRYRGKAKQTSQLHPGQLFLFKEKKKSCQEELSWVGFEPMTPASTLPTELPGQLSMHTIQHNCLPPLCCIESNTVNSRACYIQLLGSIGNLTNTKKRYKIKDGYILHLRQVKASLLTIVTGQMVFTHEPVSTTHIITTFS